MSKKIGKLLLECEYSDDSDYVSDMLLEVSSIIRKKSKSGHWYVRVENFGWRSSAGYAYIETQIGREFMFKILPDTACTWKIFNYGRGIIIQNWHHDNCTGEEKYYCMPITSTVFDLQSYKGGA
jgi:hypothetical protein